MKKLVALLCTATVAATLFCGCGAKEEPAAEAAVPAGVDPELLMKLLANPEMAALLKTLAQTIK